MTSHARHPFDGLFTGRGVVFFFGFIAIDRGFGVDTFRGRRAAVGQAHGVDFDFRGAALCQAFAEGGIAFDVLANV